MTNKKSSMSLLRLMMILICIPLTILFILSSLYLAMNNKALEDFSKQLFEYKLPPDTIIVKQYKRYGSLEGSKNKEEYLAAILLETRLSEETIKGYYFKGNFKSAKKDGNSTNIEIYRPEDTVVKSEDYENETLSLTGLKKERSSNDYIMVIIKDSSNQNWINHIGINR